MFKNTGSSSGNEALATYQTLITDNEKEFQLDERMTFKVEGNLQHYEFRLLPSVEWQASSSEC